jgi:hypothetical protein
MEMSNKPIDQLGYTTDKGFPHTSAGGTSSKTNESKMPEVIYIYTDDGRTRFVSDHPTSENQISYTRTDKVEELKAELVEFRKDKERLNKLIALTNVDGLNGWQCVLDWCNDQDTAQVLDSNGALAGQCFEEVETKHELGTPQGNEEAAQIMFRRAIDKINLQKYGII